MSQPKDLSSEVNSGSTSAAAEPGEPVHGVSLDGYATLMTRLASGQPRALLLSGAGLDESQWLEVEKTWGLRLAKAAQQGDTQMILRFGKSVEEAQRNCPLSEPSRTMAEYAAMVALIEQGTTPIATCAQFGLKLGEFFELQQAFTRRITSDPQLAKAFRELVANSGAKAS